MDRLYKLKNYNFDRRWTWKEWIFRLTSVIMTCYNSSEWWNSHRRQGTQDRNNYIRTYIFYKRALKSINRCRRPVRPCLLPHCYRTAWRTRRLRGSSHKYIHWWCGFCIKNGNRHFAWIAANINIGYWRDSTGLNFSFFGNII